ncbi:MAG TPA: hypothetical protein VI318_03080 [Baekduia sp.]
MRFRLFVLAAIVALAVPSVAVALTSRDRPPGHQQEATIAGTWDVKVSPDGDAPLTAVLTLTRSGSVIETESDQPGTGQGSWKRTGPDTFALAFKTYVFTATGDPGGAVLVRVQVKLADGTLSGPFKFDVSDADGNVVQSGSGTAEATPFVIPDL